MQVPFGVPQPVPKEGCRPASLEIGTTQTTAGHWCCKSYGLGMLTKGSRRAGLSPWPCRSPGRREVRAPRSD